MPGSAILVDWTVTNQGIGATDVSTWYDNVYLDASSTLDSGAVLLGSVLHNGSLNSGSSYTQSQLVTLPIFAAPGSYSLFVLANATRSTFESDRTNNASAPVPITLNVQLPSGGTGGGGTGGTGGGGTGTGGGGGGTTGGGSGGGSGSGSQA